ncbi:heme-binding protein 2-like [Hemitrygon akajei]|uniref:heme-binding protein 2-like n=1 Tax=Hemitrygon akajei TaxID=2704970 RepID=UPI003BFA0203
MLPVFLLVASLVSVEGLSKDHCLGYDALCTTADYEVRRYKDSVWVGIHGSSDLNIKTDIVPLYLYLTGRNLEEMRIPYTGQVLVSLTGFRVLAIYILLPEELWDNPPTATDTRVFVTRLPMMDVFARKIRRFRFSDVGDFNRTLTAQNVHVNNSNFFVYSCLG